MLFLYGPSKFTNLFPQPIVRPMKVDQWTTFGQFKFAGFRIQETFICTYVDYIGNEHIV